MARATFGAGCFWHPQQVFDQMAGVTGTLVGYMGGGKPKPTYEEVCHMNTGHAEVVQIDYDPERLSYEELLAVFWEIHDPTQVDRQGSDIGTQYRSVIFTHDDAQAALARASKAAKDRSGRHRDRIATIIQPAPTFWAAEDYHQKYIERQRQPGLLASLLGRWR